jgi:hypothetical protein
VKVRPVAVTDETVAGVVPLLQFPTRTMITSFVRAVVRVTAAVVVLFVVVVAGVPSRVGAAI